MNIIINKHLFAAYCGMIKSGYDLMDLSDEIVLNICEWISSVDFGNEVCEYFLYAKTNTIAINPYYPRGSNLSAACFFQGISIDKYIEFLQICESLEANNPEFIEWISRLPNILKQIENQGNFNIIYQNYCNCVKQRFKNILGQMKEIEAILEAKPFKTSISIAFAPNLLQAKFLADYALVEDTLYIISGIFWSCAIIHEYLHIVLKPIRNTLINIVHNYGIEQYVNVACLQKLGYLHDNTIEAKAHALDECLVRSICGVIDKSLNLLDYCQNNIQSGFTSVPQMINNLSACIWSNMTLTEVVLHTLGITK